MGGGKFLYRVTFLGVDDKLEECVYKLEQYIGSLGEDHPKEPPYQLVFEKGTLRDVENKMYPDVFRELKQKILRLSLPDPSVESEPYEHYMSI